MGGGVKVIGGCFGFFKIEYRFFSKISEIFT